MSDRFKHYAVMSNCSVKNLHGQAGRLDKTECSFISKKFCMTT